MNYLIDRLDKIEEMVVENIENIISSPNSQGLLPSLSSAICPVCIRSPASKVDSCAVNRISPSNIREKSPSKRRGPLKIKKYKLENTPPGTSYIDEKELYVNQKYPDYYGSIERLRALYGLEKMEQ